MGCAVGFVVLASIFGGCASPSASAKLDLFAQRAPLPTLVPRGQTFSMAEQVAAREPGDFTLIGAGRSMEPMYVHGTVVVVHPTALHMLRKGMAVVYRTPRGNYVAHMLLEKAGAGWRAVGLNNPDTDDVLVTPENLVGVIKHAFAPDDTVFPGDVVGRSTTKVALARGPAVSGAE